MTKRNTDDRSIAHQLLVELLVHQFAFPVKWTDTQDALLSGSRAVSRLVELGPARVLANLGQKTIQRKLASGERPIDSPVRFLASTQNVQELCYEYDAPESATEQTAGDAPTSTVVTSPPPEPTSSIPQISHTTSSMPVDSPPVEDCPPSSTDIVRILVARKLKKPIADVPTSKSIKELCGGKSTIENEVVGDLHNEFSSIPERPEDIPLKDLGVPVDADRPLGKTSSALVAKFVSSKMPARFTAASVHSYLADKWGLGPLRQAAVLIRAVAAEPPSRLSSTEAAKRYWDQEVASYGVSCGISIQPRNQTAGGGTQATPLVDSAVLNQVMEAHKRMAAKQYQALGEYLQADRTATSDADVQLLAGLQHKLDAWTAEFSAEFFSRITPTFDANKIRRYTSWWNYAREDVLALYSGDTTNCPLLHDKTALDSFVHRLASRADSQLATLVSSLARGNDYPDAFCAISTRIERAVTSAVSQPPLARPSLIPMCPRTTVTESGTIQYTSVPRPGNFTGPTAYSSFLSHRPGIIRVYSFPNSSNSQLASETAGQDYTDLFLTTLSTLLRHGVTFQGKTVLVTGAGQATSIASQLIRLLLAGGTRVIATTSRAPSAAAAGFARVYREYAAKGSELWLVPCNMASKRDVESLIEWVYGKDREWDLDAVVPFAAAGEKGVEIGDGLQPGNELAHRIMMTNVLRLLGEVVKRKRERGVQGQTTQVLLPLSPNKGVFGGDGLYPESKLGLESLLRRVTSESWGAELAVCGVEIGWTRGTGLMEGNDLVAEAVEGKGVVTFSAEEMAANIAVLMAQEFVDLCEDGPVYANFGGGLGALANCHEVLARARRDIHLQAEIARVVRAEDDRERAFTHPPLPSAASRPLKQRITLRVGFPCLPEKLPNHDIARLVDPARTVVVVGFSELGPWGSARLRWQMESAGRLSPEGYVEMAWLMGLIRHFDGPSKDGHHYVGWVDVKTGDPVDDADVEPKYGEHIKAHAGIRFVSPGTSTCYDPARKEFLQEVAVEDDLPPFDTSLAAAEALKLRHGDKVTVNRLIEAGETCRVQVKRGATILVPKAVPFPSSSVAGLLPDGWGPARYGIPKDIIQQVDPVTGYALCCVAEAFYSAGIPDPMEVFQHMHLSELGNFIGSSMGGALKTRHLYRDAYLDQEIQADTLQDTYLNTAPAWINMLLLGAAGPIKTPVGACATGLESIDSAMESIMAGKTKMCLVGGYDDLQEEESFGFAKMKATVDVAAELARGRLPSEMSRPTAESRAGFVESHGCGVQLLCRGDIALEMGLPVYAVLAGSAMAADGIGRSVPAPGKGILTFARERESDHQLLRSPSTPATTTSTTDGLSSDEFDYILASASSSQSATPLSERPFPSHSLSTTTGTSRGSPLRAALATWGLTINDIDFASLHGTSTKANDLNEAEVLHTQLTHLGRSPGRPVWAICQKSVTGHPKAPAAAWMLNGCLQVLDTGLIPGNRNADDIDPKLRAFHHLCYATQTINMNIDGQGPKAFLLTSFGFGQKSGQVVGIAPRLFFASCLSGKRWAEYRDRLKKREARAEREWQRAMMENRVVRVKARSLFGEGKADVKRVCLDPGARVWRDARTGEFRFGRGDKY
ncbi:hypothetical protein C8A03DRAFT_37321 [Achaetomium macrosporum]|uniref:beta-ketoacyl-[acyl-carrier-protein] synthase I n=1 Tax=Achaetomium macrosporum TaxID=79813 RepID=A0AAN7H4R3_9PEZI|nr:hypothetical protein C8A03DRAFT_37321 [Achaetomium macrosporum]